MFEVTLKYKNNHPCATASFRDKFTGEINFETSKKIEGIDYESYLDVSLTLRCQRVSQKKQPVTRVLIKIPAKKTYCVRKKGGKQT